ncbi:MAG: YraN family protein [Flavobacteriales bacterium]|jgi:putative endonuclease|nr:YraN family protein [Flavobacteriales bacterium]
MKREMKKSDGEREISAHYKLGLHGERLACDYLTNTGYKILHTRHRIEGIEIDIIALKDDTLVFVEVKTRRSDNLESPQDAVDIKKQHRMIRAANAYMQTSEQDVSIRFDIIAIVTNAHHSHIDHIEDAFSPFV